MSLQKMVYLIEFWHLRSLVTDQTPLPRHHINPEQKPNAVSGEYCSIIFMKQTRDGSLQGGCLRTVDIVKSSTYTV